MDIIKAGFHVHQPLVGWFPIQLCCPVAPIFPFFWQGCPFTVKQPKKDVSFCFSHGHWASKSNLWPKRQPLATCQEPSRTRGQLTADFPGWVCVKLREPPKKVSGLPFDLPSNNLLVRKRTLKQHIQQKYLPLAWLA